jgi:hypothetical protein
MFDESSICLRHILRKIDDADDDTQVTEAERTIFYMNLPTHGYNTEDPTFEMLDHATLSGAVYYSAFTKLAKSGIKDFETSSKLMCNLGAMIDQVVG